MINEKKISQAEIVNLNVKSVPGSRLKGTVQENKNIFDKLVEFVAMRINEILDTLTTDGAANISVNVDGNTISLQEFASKPVYTKGEVDSLITSATQNLIQDVNVNLGNGVFTFEKKDGTKYTVDTEIEKLPITLKFVVIDDESYLELKNQDGTTSHALVETMISNYEFDSAGDVSYEITPQGKRKRVQGKLKSAVVKPEHLHANTLAKLDEYIVLCAAERTGAQTAAAQASDGAAAALNSASTAEVHEANCEAIKNSAIERISSMISEGKADIIRSAAGQVEAATQERKKAEFAADRAADYVYGMNVGVEYLIKRIMEEVI